MRLAAMIFVTAFSLSSLSADGCDAVLQSLKLPIKAKLTGKPKHVRWGLVEKTVTQLREKLQGHSCQIRFDQVFTSKRDDFLFPILTNLLRTAPESSLEGVTVLNGDGDKLGAFHNRVEFNKRGEYNYTHYYFQFMDETGNLQSSGNRILIDVTRDRPLFLMPWKELRSRVLISTE